MKIPLIRLDPGLPLPRHANPHDAGIDLLARVDVELQPGERRLVPTGVAVAIPEGHTGFLTPRSGLAVKHGIGMVNAPGVIDAGYRGELQVILINHGQVPVRLDRGDRIAQLVVVAFATVEFEEVDELPESVRGQGGFGSSGR